MEVLDISFKVDQVAILQWAFWTLKLIVINIPWWLWILIVLAGAITLFAPRAPKKC